MDLRTGFLQEKSPLPATQPRKRLMQRSPWHQACCQGQRDTAPSGGSSLFIDLSQCVFRLEALSCTHGWGAFTHDTVHLYACVLMCKHICRKINRQDSNLADASELVFLEGFFHTNIRVGRSTLSFLATKTRNTQRCRRSLQVCHFWTAAKRRTDTP